MLLSKYVKYTFIYCTVADLFVSFFNISVIINLLHLFFFCLFGSSPKCCLILRECVSNGTVVLHETESPIFTDIFSAIKMEENIRQQNSIHLKKQNDTVAEENTSLFNIITGFCNFIQSFPIRTNCRRREIRTENSIHNGTTTRKRV